ncbi:MAG: polyhydroxyalkanoic acid system family protein [Isosphaeraceae bacterium]
MAELNITMKHGQSPDEARVNFVKAITAAHQEHAHWIKTVEWSDDRTSAILSGPGYRVTLSFDDENVHARGTIPLALKLMERPIRQFVEALLEHDRGKPA